MKEAELRRLDFHGIRAWILWNGFGVTEGSLVLYGADGTRYDYDFSRQAEQKPLIRELVFRKNGDEALPVYSKPNPFLGFASEERVGFWNVEKGRHENYLFYREADRGLVEEARKRSVWFGPADWRELFSENG